MIVTIISLIPATRNAFINKLYKVSSLCAARPVIIASFLFMLLFALHKVLGAVLIFLTHIDNPRKWCYYVGKVILINELVKSLMTGAYFHRPCPGL